MQAGRRLGRQSAGIQVPGADHGGPFTALLHYPCDLAATATRFGPYELDVSVDAPVAPGRFPLVLISHGSGGSPLLEIAGLHVAYGRLEVVHDLSITIAIDPALGQSEHAIERTDTRVIRERIVPGTHRIIREEGEE